MGIDFCYTRATGAAVQESHLSIQSCLPAVPIRALEDRTMQWITPAFEEIDLGCEINTYANAEL